MISRQRGASSALAGYIERHLTLQILRVANGGQYPSFCSGKRHQFEIRGGDAGKRFGSPGLAIPSQNLPDWLANYPANQLAKKTDNNIGHEPRSASVALNRGQRPCLSSALAYLEPLPIIRPCLSRAFAYLQTLTTTRLYKLGLQFSKTNRVKPPCQITATNDCT